MCLGEAGRGEGKQTHPSDPSPASLRHPRESGDLSKHPGTTWPTPPRSPVRVSLGLNPQRRLGALPAAGG